MLTVGRGPRAVVAGLLLALASLLLVPAPAQAADWQTVSSLHGGRLQVCTVAAGSSRLEVRMRVDNRRASHTHIGAIGAPDGRERVARPGAGRASGVRSLVVSRSATISFGMGETDGTGFGDTRRATWFRRC